MRAEARQQDKRRADLRPGVSKPAAQLTADRPQAAAPEKLQELSNSSPRAAQLRSYAAMANHATVQRQADAPACASCANKTGMPDQLKAGVESLSGLSMEHVKVHYNSALPAQLNSHAYAQGNQIHLGPGQTRHLPHEAWHVVQQAQGRVASTLQMRNGVQINDDQGLEHEADVMGDRALNHHSAPSRLTSWFPPSSIVQRYLIVGDVDFTNEVHTNGAALGATATRVRQNMELAMAPPNFLNGSFENTIYQFIQADVGGLVSNQLSKWVADSQGIAGANSHSDFGQKQQARVYSNYVDLSRAVYGWVTGKQGRRDEKTLANQVYDSPSVSAHMDSILTKIWGWTQGQGNAVNIVGELSANNPQPAVAHWSLYRNWFNHERVGDNRRVPDQYADVLQHPQNYAMRAKVATLHDVMHYFMASATHPTAGNNLLLDPPALTATTIGGRVAYARPPGSIIHRDPLDIIANRLVAPDVPTARLANRIQSSGEEQHASFDYARQNNIPMWARHSYTAARMMQLTHQVGGTPDELAATAQSIMAFWRKDYDHRSLPYHTLHEIMDFTPAYGLNYEPATRYEDMRLHILIQDVIRSLRVKANSANWNNKAAHIVDKAPDAVIAIRTELASARGSGAKLLAIKNFVHGKSNNSILRKANTTRFYAILDNIPNNVNAHNNPVTNAAGRTLIANALQLVLNGLHGFSP